MTEDSKKSDNHRAQFSAKREMVQILCTLKELRVSKNHNNQKFQFLQQVFSLATKDKPNKLEHLGVSKNQGTTLTTDQQVARPNDLT